MNNIYKNKSFGIFGLGITGTSAYVKLIGLAKELICYDDVVETREKFIDKHTSAHVVSLNDSKWTNLDEIIISPGIPPTHEVFKLAKRYSIPITSDIELFINENTNSEFTFITGTNGKSTVTALAGHILAKAGLDYHVGGNIGKPVLSLPYGRRGYILELSSFHIELLKNVSPKISAITNIMPDHLDRYKTVKGYAKVKGKDFYADSLNIIGLSSNITYGIYNKLRKTRPSKLVAISTEQFLKNSIYCNDDYLQDNFFDQKKYLLSPLPNLRGIHNKENIAIAYAICRALGVFGEFIVQNLTSFEGLAHRMQFIGRRENISFYNDSKATNISSSLASLSAFSNVIWFAGGKFKEASLDPLEPILKNIKKAYLFGESKNLFASFLDSSSPFKPEYEVFDSLEEAFRSASSFSKNITDNLTFLLAPACASYDQFKNFEERGNLFTELVRQYIKVK